VTVLHSYMYVPHSRDRFEVVLLGSTGLAGPSLQLYQLYSSNSGATDFLKIELGPGWITYHILHKCGICDLAVPEE
jgi:hypothetical protein